MLSIVLSFLSYSDIYRKWMIVTNEPSFLVTKTLLRKYVRIIEFFDSFQKWMYLTILNELKLSNMVDIVCSAPFFI